MAKVRVDHSKCIGCELCPDVCPRTFEMKGGKAITKQSEIDGDISLEKEARDTCPVEAIIIE